MKHRSSQSVLATSLIGLGLLVAGGCPMVVPLVGDALPGPQPGTHYVERSDGELFYYQLPEVRGQDGSWVRLTDDGAWYVGAGFYRLSEDYEWSWDQASEGLTLDDFLQLYDPLPAVPETP